MEAHIITSITTESTVKNWQGIAGFFGLMWTITLLRLEQKTRELKKYR